MDISLAKLIYFSPTGTTRKILEGVGGGVQANKLEHVDLTPFESDNFEIKPIHNELAIIGSPVYAGRIPVEAAKRLQRLKANGTLAVVIVTYGNREYEDALLELRDLTIRSGFNPIAGAAFIGEHSFADETMPIANGRPDTRDLHKAIEFGEKIRRKIEDISLPYNTGTLQVPGNFPYRKRVFLKDSSASTLESVCIKCEQCVAVCPVAAVTLDERIRTDTEKCIVCCACVKNCPTGARVMEDTTVREIAEWLSTNCHERKEPEIFLRY